MLDEDYGDITDPFEGRDIKVACNKNPGQQWAMTEVTPRGKSTGLSKNKDQGKEWITNIPDPSELFSLKSYDELSKIINDWLSGDEDDTGTERGATQSTDKTDDADGKSKSYGNLDDAFADLMN